MVSCIVDSSFFWDSHSEIRSNQRASPSYLGVKGSQTPCAQGPCGLPKWVMDAGLN